jgi:quercetin dioxygenase-like cupin family protein
MTPPGCGPGPHYHEREDEWFYIIEGRVSFLLNGTWTDLLPGDCVYSPRGSIHGFKNHTDQPIRVFINIAPAGFEHFFAVQPRTNQGGTFFRIKRSMALQLVPPKNRWR